MPDSAGGVGAGFPGWMGSGLWHGSGTGAGWVPDSRGGSEGGMGGAGPSPRPVGVGRGRGSARTGRACRRPGAQRLGIGQASALRPRLSANRLPASLRRGVLLRSASPGLRFRPAAVRPPLAAPGRALSVPLPRPVQVSAAGPRSAPPPGGGVGWGPGPPTLRCGCVSRTCTRRSWAGARDPSPARKSRPSRSRGFGPRGGADAGPRA